MSEADLNQQEDSGSLEDKSIRQAAHPEEFLNILVSNPKEMVEFLEFMIKNRKDLSKEIFNTLLNYYLHEYKATGKFSRLNLLDRKVQKYFILIVYLFLDSLIIDADSSSRLAQETKILTFMRLHCDEYDNDQAMILCSSNEFAPGTAYIYEKREMYGEILR